MLVGLLMARFYVNNCKIITFLGDFGRERLEELFSKGFFTFGRHTRVYVHTLIVYVGSDYLLLANVSRDPDQCRLILKVRIRYFFSLFVS